MVDMSLKNLADDSSKGERELVDLINSTISHEMRNPLNCVAGQTEIMKIKCEEFKKQLLKMGKNIPKELYDKMKAFYDIIERSNQQCFNSSSKLMLNVEDLLAFAHIKAKSFFKNISRFNISDCIDEIIEIDQLQSNSKNVKVMTHFYGFSPKSSAKNSEQDMLVNTDKLRLKQIVMNLYSNALKFTKDNGSIHIICQYA